MAAGFVFTTARDVVAEHPEHPGRHERVTDRGHLVGVAGGPRPAETEAARPKPELLRPRRRVRGRRRGDFLMAGVDHETLAGWLTRLQLTAIRDQLDNLLDEAGGRRS